MGCHFLLHCTLEGVCLITGCNVESSRGAPGPLDRGSVIRAVSGWDLKQGPIREGFLGQEWSSLQPVRRGPFNSARLLCISCHENLNFLPLSHFVIVTSAVLTWCEGVPVFTSLRNCKLFLRDHGHFCFLECDHRKAQDLVKSLTLAEAPPCTAKGSCFFTQKLVLRI